MVPSHRNLDLRWTLALVDWTATYCIRGAPRATLGNGNDETNFSKDTKPLREEFVTF